MQNDSGKKVDWSKNKVGLYTAAYVIVLLVVAATWGIIPAIVCLGSFLFGWQMVYTNFKEDTGLELSDVLARFKADYQKEQEINGKG